MGAKALPLVHWKFLLLTLEVLNSLVATLDILPLLVKQPLFGVLALAPSAKIVIAPKMVQIGARRFLGP